METESPCVEVIYQQLVQLVARAFYKLELKTIFKDENDPAEMPAPPSKGRAAKKLPADFTGLGIVVMDALLNRPWWEEEEFARKLQLPMRPVRQVLRLLETHFLVAREHRKEKRGRKGKGVKGEDPELALEEEFIEEHNLDKGLLISYCSLDYQRMFDMARLRLYKMRQVLKSELEDRRAVQEYTCPRCLKTYTTLHAAALIKSDGLFHCEDCDEVLESGGGAGHGETVSRRERTKLVKAKQARLEQELLPLTKVLTEIEKRIAAGDQVPDFGTLAVWAAGEAEKTGGAASGRSGRRPDADQVNIKMDVGETQLPADTATAPRVLPPWLQRQSGPASSSYSLSQEVSEDTKEFLDVKSTSPEDAKAQAEADYVQQYKERMANISTQGQPPATKRHKTETGWEEVGIKSEDGWQEVPAAEEDEWEEATPVNQSEAQQKDGLQGIAGPSHSMPDEDPGDDEDWEDA